MSAFMCSNEHLYEIVRIALYGPSDTLEANWTDKFPAFGADAMLAQLFHENVESLHYRYGDERDEYEAPPAVIWSKRSSSTTLQAIKTVRCYQYQACEHPGWEESEAYKFTSKLLTRLEYLAGNGYEKDPFYATAVWGSITEDIG